MKKVKCLNSHWFDADEYNVCPHCGAEKMTEDSANRSQPDLGTDEKQKKKGFFWGKSKQKPENREIEFSSKGYEPGATEKRSSTEHAEKVIVSSQQKDMEWRGTEDISIPKTDVLFHKSDDVEMPQKPSPMLAREDERREALSQKTFLPEEPKKQESPREKGGASRGLDDIKTVSIFANDQGEEPVTGWIVGIAGVYRGCSFSLKTGVNVIARDAEAYVCLKKDMQVSRMCHAKILYEPKKKIFYLGEGENALTYCNDELVSGRIPLSAYDVMEIGGGKYMFIPFCGERFDWEKEGKSEDK